MVTKDAKDAKEKLEARQRNSPGLRVLRALCALCARPAFPAPPALPALPALPAFPAHLALPALRALSALLLLLVVACSSRPPDEPKDYAAKLAADRAAKDAAFQKDSEPIPENRKAAFLPLEYFPIDPDYNVPAQLKPSGDRSIFEMTTSAGNRDKFRRVGTLEFMLKGQPMKLTAFAPAAAKTDDRLFVPFSDLTSGTETYPAGRFMDLDRSPTGIYEVDFNRAYNPYCYYSPTWECPYPPAENRLKIPVRAGEKMKQSEAESSKSGPG